MVDANVIKLVESLNKINKFNILLEEKYFGTEKMEVSGSFGLVVWVTLRWARVVVRLKDLVLR